MSKLLIPLTVALILTGCARHVGDGEDSIATGAYVASTHISADDWIDLGAGLFLSKTYQEFSGLTTVKLHMAGTNFSHAQGFYPDATSNQTVSVNVTCDPDALGFVMMSSDDLGVKEFGRTKLQTAIYTLVCQSYLTKFGYGDAATVLAKFDKDQTDTVKLFNSLGVDVARAPGAAAHADEVQQPAVDQREPTHPVAAPVAKEVDFQEAVDAGAPAQAPVEQVAAPATRAPEGIVRTPYEKCAYELPDAMRKATCGTPPEAQ